MFLASLEQPRTKLKCPSQSSDDGDRVGRVGAELMEGRVEGVPLVF